MSAKNLTAEEAEKIKEEELKKLEKNENHLENPEKTILKVKAVFPFQLFPDELIVYPTDVRKISHYGPGMEGIEEYDLHEISRVEVGTAPFFAQLRIVPSRAMGQPLVIDHLKREDAIKVQRVLEEMMEKARVKS